MGADDNGYRLERDGRGDGEREENAALLLFSGLHHDAALRNLPTDSTSHTKRDRVIGGPQSEVATGQREAPKAATLQQHEERQGTHQGHVGGPEKERKEASYGTYAGRPETERRNCLE